MWKRWNSIYQDTGFFYAVARAGNISRAAKDLYISQPAISKAISKLEDSLKVSLFTRSSRGVHLTPEGELLFGYVQTAFQALDLGEQELKKDPGVQYRPPEDRGQQYPVQVYPPALLKNFIEQYPHIKITIEGQATAKTISMLEQHMLDVGLVAEPSVRSGLSFIPVMDIQDTFRLYPALSGEPVPAGGIRGRPFYLRQYHALRSEQHDPPPCGRIFKGNPYRTKADPGGYHHGSADRICKNRPGCCLCD